MTKAITLQNTTRGCINNINIELDAGGNPVESVFYVVKDGTGAVYKRGNVILSLSGATKTSLLSYIDSVILPAIDTLEGL